MNERLKQCYKCNTIDDVKIIKYERTVKYKGKTVTYLHESNKCEKCDRIYDYEPIQTEMNREMLRKKWLEM